MLIDVHTHLGNILYPNGKSLIYKTGVTKEQINDPQDLNEKLLMRNFGLGKLIYRLTHEKITKAQIARGMTATLENLQHTLNENKISFQVCMPIAPYLTFEDLVEAAVQEPRIIPFTSIDFIKNAYAFWARSPFASAFCGSRSSTSRNLFSARNVCRKSIYSLVNLIFISIRRLHRSCSSWPP